MAKPQNQFPAWKWRKPKREGKRDGTHERREQDYITEQREELYKDIMEGIREPWDGPA